MASSDPALLLLCRPGFEKECLAEITEVAGELGCHGWSRLESDSGFVLFETDQAQTLYRRLSPLVFAREAWPVTARLEALPASDRVGPLLSVLEAHHGRSNDRFGQVFCDFAEGDAYRATARFAGKFVHPLRTALRRAGWLTAADRVDRPALHVLFLDSTRAIVGVDDPRLRPAWPMGVARLRCPPAAPSRSTLKLEEAFGVFLGPHWRERLAADTTAVDLGAAPGGWTWQLVQRGLRVQAIDNGPMDAGLMSSGQVEHLRADGFNWQPEHPVDWLVCDMVEQPARVAATMLHWLGRGWTRRAIFNLKLPMKKRWQAWRDIREQIRQSDSRLGLSARHLYFDREEITVFLELTDD